MEKSELLLTFTSGGGRYVDKSKLKLAYFKGHLYL